VRYRLRSQREGGLYFGGWELTHAASSAVERNLGDPACRQPIEPGARRDPSRCQSERVGGSPPSVLSRLGRPLFGIPLVQHACARQELVLTG
jgi:hypothetical protein